MDLEASEQDARLLMLSVVLQEQMADTPELLHQKNVEFYSTKAYQEGMERIHVENHLPITYVFSSKV